jgi:hypothetical protein
MATSMVNSCTSLALRHSVSYLLLLPGPIRGQPRLTDTTLVSKPQGSLKII